MRMRKKPNMDARLAFCEDVLIKEPQSLRGNWNTIRPDTKLHIEVGCGKGRFTVGTAADDEGTTLIAIEKVVDVLIIAMERANAEKLENVRFIRCDVKNLNEIFEPSEASRIYINFCDPWPKSRDAKHRLTSAYFLRIYEAILPLGGEIHFKTDNAPLFDWSIESFLADGWELSEVTHDLHENGIQGIMTDYEAKFHGLGTKINRLVARKVEKTKTLAEPLERLRNASLSDAKGKQEVVK